MIQSFEERFDENFPEDTLVSAHQDWTYDALKSFIRQEKELSREEEQERIMRIIDTSSRPLSDIKKYIN